MLIYACMLYLYKKNKGGGWTLNNPSASTFSIFLKVCERSISQEERQLLRTMHAFEKNDSSVKETKVNLFPWKQMVVMLTFSGLRYRILGYMCVYWCIWYMFLIGECFFSLLNSQSCMYSGGSTYGSAPLPNHSCVFLFIF